MRAQKRAEQGGERGEGGSTADVGAMTADGHQEKSSGFTLTKFEPKVRLGNGMPAAQWRKAVQIVHSHPAKGELGALARRVFNAVCIHVQDCYRTMTTAERHAVKEMRASPIFTMTVGRVRTLVGIAGYNNERVYEALNTLYNMKFVYNVMGDSGVNGEEGVISVVERVQSRFIHTLSIGQGVKAGYISFEMPLATLQMVVEPHPYANLDMRIENALGTSPAIALYENLARYLGTKKRKTALMPTEEWIKLIAGPDKYQNNYRDFKRQALEPAIQRLRSLDGVPFFPELVEEKGPKNRVVQLQFKLHAKANADAGEGNGPPPSWQDGTIQALKGVWRLKPEEIHSLAVMASEDEVIAALRRGEKSLSKKHAAGDSINDRYKYLTGILLKMRQEGENYQAEIKDAQVQLIQRELPGMKHSDPETFRLYQSAVMDRRLSELEPDQLEQLRADFAADKGQGGTIAALLKQGWEANKVALNGAFRHWLLVDRRDLLGMALHLDYELSYDAWLQQGAPKA